MTWISIVVALPVVLSCGLNVGVAGEQESPLKYFNYSYKKGEVVGVHFFGPADLLVDQQAKETRWHENPKLAAVILSHTTITRDVIKYVSSLEQVVSLTIGNGVGSPETTVEKGAYGPLEKMQALEYLELIDDHLDDSEFSFLGKLKLLRDLSILGVVERDTFAHISQLKRLQNLYCHGIENASEKSLRQFSENANLRQVSLGRIDKPNHLLPGLCSRPLQRLSFSCKELTAEHIDLITAVGTLEYLDIDGIPASSADKLRNLKQLKTLSITFVGDTELANLDFLKCLPNLRLLSLKSKVDVRDTSLDGLKNHTRIQYIALPTCVTLTEKHLKVLETIPKLNSVLASFSEIPQDVLKTRIPRVRFEIRNK